MKFSSRKQKASCKPRSIPSIGMIYELSERLKPKNSLRNRNIRSQRNRSRKPVLEAINYALWCTEGLVITQCVADFWIEVHHRDVEGYSSYRFLLQQQPEDDSYSVHCRAHNICRELELISDAHHQRCSRHEIYNVKFQKGAWWYWSSDDAESATNRAFELRLESH